MTAITAVAAMIPVTTVVMTAVSAMTSVAAVTVHYQIHAWWGEAQVGRMDYTAG